MIPGLRIKLLIIFILQCFISIGQEENSNASILLKINEKWLKGLDKKAASLEEGIFKKTEIYLKKLERQEAKLKKKLWKEDSLLAKQLFPEALSKKYEQLKSLGRQGQNYGFVYSSHLDSLSTGIEFLRQNQLVQKGSGQLDALLKQYGDLQKTLNATEQIRSFIRQREAVLKRQFQNLGMVKELKKLRKQVYYYQAQIEEYKAILDDPDKLEKKLLELLTKIPQFDNFFKKNSVFASLYRGISIDPDPNMVVTGLQTRAQLTQFISANFSGDQRFPAVLQQNVQSSAGSASATPGVLSLINKIRSSSSDIEDMYGFVPNNQKTKSFKKRLELGTNFQTQKSNSFFPATSDLALSLGYKVNDKSIIGIGVSYKLGLGEGFRNLKFSNEGIGLRSFMDLKLKGSLFMSGGFEYNYQKPFTAMAQLYDLDVWQKSGLIGISKIVSLKSGVLKKARMQLLWDFLSYDVMPRTKPFKFRVGYNF